MEIVQITPGAGGMYCGNCFRDNAFVAALRGQGHNPLMVPLYLPLTLEDQDYSAGTPIFFSGLNVYLEQKSALFRKAPDWLHQMLASRRLLKWVARKAANTTGSEVAEITLSMLRGEEGNQARELDELLTWLERKPPPDVVCLSNVLLIGLARGLKARLGCPVVCMLQGEDHFLDGLPTPHREAAWKTLAERVLDADQFVAPSHYFGELMSQRLGIPSDRISTVHNGINLEGFAPAATMPDPPVIGYFGRMCREKGLDHLVEAFLSLKARPEWRELRLKVGGGMTASDKRWVKGLRRHIERAGWGHHAEFLPNVSREEKLNFLRSINLLSTPALYGEAFGLYVLEALAAGVPVVQPRHAAFPELIEATDGGLLYDPGSPDGLAEALHCLLLQPEQARAHGEAGRQKVLEHFSIERMAENMVQVFRDTIEKSKRPTPLQLP